MANHRIPELNSENITYQSWNRNLANELRIGNWVNVIKRVPVRITPDHIKSIAAGDTDYSPIPLTPEILEKCGFREFVDHSGNFYSHNGNFKYYLQKEVFCIFDERATGVNYIIDFKYLHQLQNLFFALTGEELQINL